jgi:CRP/FNR family transcriptional regulator, cyclic AMP receptor protein
MEVQKSPRQVIFVTVFPVCMSYYSAMRSIQEACFECVLRPERLFCNLPAEAMKDFDALKSLSLYATGRTLFREGTKACGIFVLCEGNVKLSVCSQSGKRLTLRIAGPGEVLGLSASLCNGPYELTAEIVGDAQVAMINRKDLLQFLNDHREISLQLAQLLSGDLRLAYDRVRAIGLGRGRRRRPLRDQGRFPVTPPIQKNARLC